MRLFAKAVNLGDWIILKSGGTGFRISEFMIIRRGMAVKLPTIALAAALAPGGSFANAQSGTPGGAGSAAGDPAASSANPSSSLTTGSYVTPGRSGSGTSASGGSDANDDQGRPDSSQRVRPYDQRSKPE